MLCFECGLQDRTGYMGDSRKRVTYRIEKYTNAIIFGLVRIGVCLSISSTLIKPFMYSNCLVTLSHLSLHYNSSVCFPFVPSSAERLGFWGHEPLNFGCLSFAERLAFLFLPRYCLIKTVSPLIRGLTSRPLLFKVKKSSQTRAQGSEHH